MNANGWDGGHLADESMVHMGDMEPCVDIIYCWHMNRDQMNRQMMVVAPLGYSHPYQDFVFSILSVGFGTKFSPICYQLNENNKHLPWEWVNWIWIYRLFTWVSVRLKLKAKFSLSHTDRYRVVLNLFSNETNCSYVNAVLALWTETFINKILNN